MYQRGNRTPPAIATATVITTASAAMPRNAFGKPNSCACQLLATVPQLMTELKSHAKVAFVSAASARASMDSTNDASRPSSARDDHLDRGARPPRLGRRLEQVGVADRPRARRARRSFTSSTTRRVTLGSTASPPRRRRTAPPSHVPRSCHGPGPAVRRRPHRDTRASPSCARAEIGRAAHDRADHVSATGPGDRRLGSPRRDPSAARLRLPRPPRHAARRGDRPAGRGLGRRRGRGARRGDAPASARSTRRTRCSCWRRPRSRTCRRNLPDELEDADDLLLLGCDSMLELDGEIFGKPADAERGRPRAGGRCAGAPACCTPATG